jgi:hypothetical protein
MKFAISPRCYAQWNRNPTECLFDFTTEWHGLAGRSSLASTASRMPRRSQWPNCYSKDARSVCDTWWRRCACWLRTEPLTLLSVWAWHVCSTRRASAPSLLPSRSMRLMRQVLDDHHFQYRRLLTLADMSNRLRKSGFTILIWDGQKIMIWKWRHQPNWLTHDQKRRIDTSRVIRRSQAAA